MPAVFTSLTLSYLAKARVLARSVKRCNPSYRFYLVLAEPAPPSLVEGIASGREPFDRLVTIDDLPINNKLAWLFGLDVMEACTGVSSVNRMKGSSRARRISVGTAIRSTTRAAAARK